MASVYIPPQSGVKTFETILELKQDVDTKVREFGKKAHNASRLVEYLYQKPVVSISDIVEPLNISKQTANLLIKDFETKEILVETTGHERNKLFVFKRYLDAYSQV